MIAAVPAAYRSSTAKRGNPLRLAALGALGAPRQARRLVQVLRAFTFSPSLFLLSSERALVPTPALRRLTEQSIRNLTNLLEPK